MFYSNRYINLEDYELLKNRNSEILNKKIKNKNNITNVYEYKKLFHDKSINKITEDKIKLENIHNESIKNSIYIY